MVLKFTGSFTQQEAIPEKAIQAAIAVMRHGRLHRYNVVAGETAETVLLEKEFADSCDAKYCLAVASGGYALTTALRASGIQKNDIVLITTIQNDCPNACAISLWHLNQLIYQHVRKNAHKQMKQVRIISFLTDGKGEPLTNLNEIKLALNSKNFAAKPEPIHPTSSPKKK